MNSKAGRDIVDVLNFTQSIIDRCGPRPSGSKASQKAAFIIRDKLADYCDHATVQPFLHRPKAFLGYMKFDAAFFILASILLVLGFMKLAIIGYILCHIVIILEFGRYHEFIDFLFQKKRGYNVMGMIEPEKEVKEQIVLSAHHDSAYEFRFLSIAPRLYFFLIFAAIASDWVVTVATIVYAGYSAITGVTLFPLSWLINAVILGVIFNIPFFFFLKNKATPGAGDNLVASSILVKLAEYYTPHQRKRLTHTRLIFVSFDGEEAGLRGSRAFALKNKSMLKAVPTCNLNLESLYDIKRLIFLVSDINGTVKLSKTMARECIDVAKGIGCQAGEMAMHFGYGATDAAELAKIGVQATSMVALNPEFSKGGVVYHTQRDTVDKLDPHTLKTCVTLIKRYIRNKRKKLA